MTWSRNCRDSEGQCYEGKRSVNPIAEFQKWELQSPINNHSAQTDAASMPSWPHWSEKCKDSHSHLWCRAHRRFCALLALEQRLNQTPCQRRRSTSWTDCGPLSTPTKTQTVTLSLSKHATFMSKWLKMKSCAVNTLQLPKLVTLHRKSGKAKAGMVHSVSGWSWGVQVKLWDPLRTRAIHEHLRGVFMTRRYTNPCLPSPLPLYVH